MKNLLLICFLFSSNLFAATPFTISVNKLNAILEHQDLHAEVFNAIDSIEFIKHDKKGVSSFLFTTKKCKFVVEVSASGDSISPEWEVLKTETSGCK